MEALILAIIITYAVKKAAEGAHDHWQASRAANRKASKGKPVRQRARSAAIHDSVYWAAQIRGAFPQVRHGWYMGWHSGRIAQLEGREARAKARADHADVRARVTGAVREQRRRQEEALERIRAAARQDAPDPPPARCEHAPASCPSPAHCPCRCPDCDDEAAAQPRAADARQDPRPPRLPPGSASDNSHATTPTEGNTMSGDTTYRQQMAELEAIRSSAEEEVNSTRRRMMTSRLDILQNLGLDSGSLAEAAAIDDALREQEKAARQTLDAADAAIAGLSKRHGGIQEAVDSSPVDKPADGEFYTD